MECPRCRSMSVQIQNGTKVCAINDCTFIDLHPITYDNDVMHYQGEDQKENRFSTLYSQALTNGGIQMERQAEIDQNYKKGKRIIANWCFVLKLNECTMNVATARLLTILRIFSQNEDQKHRHIFSIKNITAYCIYSACFQNQLFFQQLNIAKLSQLSLKEWKRLIYEMNNLLKFKIKFIPQIQPKHLLIRVCRKYNIRNQEKNAMIQMCQRFNQDKLLDEARINTVAAIAFWKITQNSQIYKNQFELSQICKNHEKMWQQKIKSSEISKCFDVTPQTVRKVFNEVIESRFYERYLPNWQGRIKLEEKC